MAHWGSNSYDVVEGWTSQLTFQLLSCGEAFVISATTDHIVTPFLINAKGAEIATSSGDVTIITAACGEVGYTPTSTSVFLAADEPYTLRFRVEDSGGLFAYFPNSEPFVVSVRSG